MEESIWMQKSNFANGLTCVLLASVILFPSFLNAKGDQKISYEDLSYGVWIMPLGEFGRQNDNHDLKGYRCNIGGVVAGIDAQTTNDIIFGAALSYARSLIKLLHEDSRTTLYTYQGILYSTINFTPTIFADVSLSLGRNAYYRNRTFTDSNGFNTATADFRGHLLNLYGEIGNQFKCRNVFVTPLASARYVYLRDHENDEVVNGTRNIHYRPKNATIVTLGIGLEVESVRKLKFYKMLPELHLLAYYDVQEGDANVSNAFILGGPVISLNAHPGRFTGVIGGSLHFDLCNSLELLLDYDFQAKAHYYNNIVYLNLRYNF